MEEDSKKLPYVYILKLLQQQTNNKFFNTFYQYFVTLLYHRKVLLSICGIAYRVFHNKCPKMTAYCS